MWALKLLALLTASAAAGPIAEPRTGIVFPDALKGAKLSKLGVRTKGPIKVYAVGLYEAGPAKTFQLKMAMGVGAEKMSGALADALKPRCSDAKDIEAFEACLMGGLPSGAPKGTTLTFDTGGGKLGFAVNDKKVGTVPSKNLANAFAGIYTDQNAVCKLEPVSAIAEASEASEGKMPFAQKAAFYGAAAGYGIGKLIQLLH